LSGLRQRHHVVLELAIQRHQVTDQVLSMLKRRWQKIKDQESARALGRTGLAFFVFFAVYAVTTVAQVAISGGGFPPYIDSNVLIFGSADKTKGVRFEVDGLTTNTTRVVTIPDANITLGNVSGTTDTVAKFTTGGLADSTIQSSGSLDTFTTHIGITGAAPT